MATPRWHVGPHALMLGWVCALSLAGCQNTTGDPRAGGLFGWSREKAELRQGQLAAQAASASAMMQAEQARSSELTAQKQVAQDEVQALTARLNTLTQENQMLEQQLTDLRQRQGQSSAKLQSMLRDLDAHKLARTDAPLPGSQAARRQRADDIDQRNAQLKQAILFLLKR